MATFCIITTTYNHNLFIWNCIQSILDQSFWDWELLIWDDNSTDETFNIVTSFTQKDKRIKARKHKENLWIIWNMNFLTSKITPWTKYITFLEWDDMYDKNNLKTKFELLNKIKWDYLLVNSFKEIDWEWKTILPIINDLVKYKTRLKKWFNETYNNKNLWMLNPIKSWWCSCIKQSMVWDFFPIINPSNEKMFGVIDYFTLLKISQKYKIYFSNKQLLLYRTHWNNFSGYKQSQKNQDQFQIIYKYFWNKIWEIQKNWLTFQKTYYQAICFLFEKNYKKALKEIFYTFKIDKTFILLQRIKLIIRIFLSYLFQKTI